MSPSRASEASLPKTYLGVHASPPAPTMYILAFIIIMITVLSVLLWTLPIPQMLSTGRVQDSQRSRPGDGEDNPQRRWRECRGLGTHRCSLSHPDHHRHHCPYVTTVSTSTPSSHTNNATGSVIENDLHPDSNDSVPLTTDLEENLNYPSTSTAIDNHSFLDTLRCRNGIRVQTPSPSPDRSSSSSQYYSTITHNAPGGNHGRIPNILRESRLSPNFSTNFPNSLPLGRDRNLQRLHERQRQRQRRQSVFIHGSPPPNRDWWRNVRTRDGVGARGPVREPVLGGRTRRGSRSGLRGGRGPGSAFAAGTLRRQPEVPLVNGVDHASDEENSVEQGTEDEWVTTDGEESVDEADDLLTLNDPNLVGENRNGAAHGSNARRRIDRLFVNGVTDDTEPLMSAGLGISNHDGNGNGQTHHHHNHGPEHAAVYDGDDEPDYVSVTDYYSHLSPSPSPSPTHSTPPHSRPPPPPAPPAPPPAPPHAVIARPGLRATSAPAQRSPTNIDTNANTTTSTRPSLRRWPLPTPADGSTEEGRRRHMSIREFYTSMAGSGEQSEGVLGGGRRGGRQGNGRGNGERGNGRGYRGRG